MKECPKSGALTALMEGWLDPEEARQLRAHAAACTRCRRTLSDLEAAVSLLAREAGPVDPPPRGYEALLESAIAVRDTLPLPGHGRSLWFRRAAAVAAVAVLAISAALLVEFRTPTSPPPAETAEGDILEELIQEHALATSRNPFSDGAFMWLVAQSPRKP